MNRGLPRAALALALALFGLFLLWRFLATVATSVLFLVVGVLLAVVLSGPVEWLHRRFKVPRSVAVVSTALAVLGTLGVAGYLLMPALVEQTRQVLLALPGALDLLLRWAAGMLERLGVPLGDIGAPSFSALASLGRRLLGGGLALFESLASLLFGLVVVAFLPLYLAASPETVVGWTVGLLPRHHRHRAREVLSAVRAGLLGWVKGRLLSMAVVGALSTAALYAIGVPGALFLGVFAGLVEFVPYFGPVIAAVPALLLTLSGDPTDALWVLLAYVVIQQVEGYLITPLLMQRATSLHPAAVIVSVTLLSAAFGLLGTVIAVPAAIVAKVLIEELWSKRLESETHEGSA
jgi:predicted PurR-regulated permease PerM